MPQLAELRITAIDADGNAIVGATVTAYREGASVSTATTGTSPLTIPVYHPGKIKTGDYVFIGTHAPSGLSLDVIGGSPYLVTSTSSTSITISGFFATLTISINDRLIPSNNLPTIYQDDQGTVASTNPLTTDSSGEARGFVEYAAYDVITSGSGVVSRLQEGVVCGTEAPGQIRYADAYATGSSTGGIQEAVDDLPSAGGSVYCSGGKTYTTDACIWLHSGVTLFLNGATIQRNPSSITNSSANISGSVINSSPKNSNGTVATASTTLSNIAIIGPGIIDGSQASISLTNTGVGAFGITTYYTDGFIIDNVRIQNCLQDGIDIVSSKNVHLNNITLDTIGTWTTVATRNGISLYNYNETAGWSQYVTISNITMKSIGDEAIAVSSFWNFVTVNNITVDGCDIIFELGTENGNTMQGWAISNISGVNVRSSLVTFGTATDGTFKDISFDNCCIQGDSTLHELYAIGASALVSFTGIRFSKIRFTNLNSKGTAQARWVTFQPDASHTVTELHISDSFFSGLSSDTATDAVGLTLRGPTSNCYISNVEFKDIPGIGIAVNDNTFVATTQNIHFNACVVNGCNYDGIQVVSTASASTIKEIYWTDCTSIDVAKQGGAADAGWRLGISTAGTISNIYFSGCRSFKTSGSNHKYGIHFFQSAGTLDSVKISGSDFSGTVTDWFTSAGTVTNVHFLAPRGRGTDIVAAATISIPANGNTFHVTGNTNITNGITVNPWDNGRHIVLVFEGTPTLSDTSTNNLAGNFVAAGSTNGFDTLTLLGDGTNWNECGRSAN